MSSVNYKSPSEIIDYLIDVGIDKANKSFIKLLLLGFLAGSFIALGAVGNIIVSSSLIKVDVGAAKFLGASVFPVGLLMVVLLGAELFTSNCMLSVALIDKKISLFKLLRNWTFVYIFNFLGSIFIAYITIKTHNFNGNSLELLENIVEHKVHTSAYLIFLKGILCNVLVCGGVLLAYSAKDVIGKIWGIWFPIMLFIVLGYDHCVANMFYLSAAKYADIGITFSGIFHNLLYATLGNIFGGAILMGLSLYYAHHKK